MKVRCVNDCFFQGREFRVNDRKYNGVYDIGLKPGEKLPPHLVPIEEPKKVAPAVKKPAATKQDDDVLS